MRQRLLSPDNFESIVHKDRSDARIAHVEATKATGETFIVALEFSQHQELLRRVRASLEGSRNQLEAEAANILRQELATVFNPMKEKGAVRFADWYFAYATSYRLLTMAGAAVASHAVDFGSKRKVSEAVASDLEGYILSQYERLVLRPEIHDARLSDAYRRSVQRTHASFRETVSKALSGCPEAVQTALLLEGGGAGAAPNAEITLDWEAQLHKIRDVPAAYEKVPEISLALVAVSAAAGKAIGTKAGAALAAKGTAALGAKLSSPFVAKQGAAAVTVSVGAGIAGPAGAVAGAATGLVIDFVVSQGLALVQREEFLRDVHEVVDATAAEWEALLKAELSGALQSWLAAATRCLPDAGH